MDREDVDLYDGIARNDWVVYTKADNTANDTAVITKADLLSGKITEVSGDDITIDGTVYTVDDSYTVGTPAIKIVMNVGATLTDAVVYNGYVFDSSVNASSATAEDYIVAVSNGEASFGTVRIRAMFSDGTKQTIELDQIYVGSSYADATTGNTTDISGKMFTFTTNSNDEYTLRAVTAPSPSVSVGKVSNSSDKVGFIGNNAVSDDAVIFVQYDSNSSYDVISGATMKTMNVGTAKWTVNFIQNDNNASTGVGSVNVAYVTYNDDSLSVSDTNYGYITAVSKVQNENNRVVDRVTLWTKDGSVTLNTTTGAANDGDTVKGNVVSYTLNSDGAINEIEDVSVIAALTAKTDSRVWIGGTAYDLTDDTIILGIDVDDVSGSVENGTSADLTVDENVYYVTNSDNEVELIVYATNGTIATPSAS